MKYFDCDYNEGAHEKILARLTMTNREQTPGYGEDAHCARAEELIVKQCKKDVKVHFMVGGTQTNLTVISALLRPHQGVISAESGHINTHETGAIENTGHKVLSLATKDGKINSSQIKDLCIKHEQDESRIHTVQPGMVYLSHPTEWGTTYTLQELQEIHTVCKEHKLLLYVDGARLAYGLAEKGCSVDIQALAKYCDLFYIGGTKCGALFGEALVIANKTLRKDFYYLIKQKGAMLAKGRLLGIQFETLFTDGLYQQIGQHGVAQAEKIREACRQAGYDLYIENGTNQIFPILPEERIRSLRKNYSFLDMGKTPEGRPIVRFCTSWATREEDVEKLTEQLVH